MLTRTSAVLSFLTLIIAGCGGSGEVEVKQEVAQSKPGVNGGIAFPLPDNKGFAEVVLERGRPGQPVAVAVYLLDDSLKAPIKASATAKFARLQMPGEDAPRQVSLNAREATAKKAVGKKFASDPGAYDFDELKGEIGLSLDGAEVLIPFAFR